MILEKKRAISKIFLSGCLIFNFGLLSASAADPNQVIALKNTHGMWGWNKYLEEHGGPKIDLSGADLSGISAESPINIDGIYGLRADERPHPRNGFRALLDLQGANLSGTNLSQANLAGANLAQANLTGANLSGANLRGATFRSANLTNANFTGADLDWADFSWSCKKNAIFDKIQGVPNWLALNMGEEPDPECISYKARNP